MLDLLFGQRACSARYQPSAFLASIRPLAAANHCLAVASFNQTISLLAASGAAPRFIRLLVARSGDNQGGLIWRQSTRLRDTLQRIHYALCEVVILRTAQQARILTLDRCDRPE